MLVAIWVVDQTSVLQLAEQMDCVLNYQEMYLGQIQLLNVVPIKELAATFSNLKVRESDLTVGWGGCWGFFMLLS